MEYGLTECLPIYSGGLGVLAADHLKSASELGIPMVGIGLLYRRGYFKQKLNVNGWQEEEYKEYDFYSMPVLPWVNEDYSPVVIEIDFPDRKVPARVWKVLIGRIVLYLLDTDIPENKEDDRRITGTLYGGDLEMRIQQEIVLGIGGTEVLNTLGIKYSVLHLNEGHPAFALLERIRERIKAGMSYKEAVQQVKATSVFTTHTPVPAGHDVFPFYLMKKYFRLYWPTLGLDQDSFLKLGIHPQSPNSGFNMTAFALRMCKYRNGVSRRHGEVTRKMWYCIWPELEEEKVPIDYVTNGVHVPTWIEPKMELLFNKYLGPDWLANHDNPVIWKLIDEIPDDELWKTHYWLKMKLINSIRERARIRWTKDRVSTTNVVAGGALLDPSVLTLGFARRFAPYKRADLIFHDWERLRNILTNQWKPIQIIFAGKAHPADDPGKRVLQRIFNAAHNPDLAGRIAFVEDYGEQLAQYLVHGVDVWLNDPLPPMEASGTSGMKAALNGVPNLSIRDGWWIEGFNGANGWAFGEKNINGSRDKVDAGAIYQILEENIIPIFYQRANDGIPHSWVQIMKESIKSNGPRFSARRMVKEYVRKFYAPALKNA